VNLIETIDSARVILKDPLPATRVFPDNSSGYNKDDEMIEWFNFAQIEVQNILGQTHEHYFVTSTSINIIANQEEYSMPCGNLNIVRVEDNTNSSAPTEIFPMTLNEKDSYRMGVISERSGLSDIMFYAIKGNSFIFRPRPITSKNSGVKVYFSKMVDTINTATVCSVIPNQYHELIRDGIVEQGMIKAEATAEALAIVLGRRNRQIKQMMESAENRQTQRSRCVRRRKYV